MRWNYIDREQRYIDRKHAKCTWRPWFAWYPVVVDDKVIWLETLMRKGSVSRVTEAGTIYLTFEYKEPSLHIG